MWNWNNNLNAEMNLNKNLVDSFKKYATVSGILFIIMGMVGILFPVIMTYSSLIFVAYLMLLAGIFSGWLTWQSNVKDWAGWLKSFMLIIVAILLLARPEQGAAAMGLLFAVYFFTDAFAGFGLAFSLRPEKIWLFWLFNAITSLILGVLFLINWPASSYYLIGLLVGVSLLFDGIALLSGAKFVNDITEDKQ